MAISGSHFWSYKPDNPSLYKSRFFVLKSSYTEWVPWLRLNTGNSTDARTVIHDLNLAVIMLSIACTHFLEKHLLIESIITNDIIDKFFRCILVNCFVANMSAHWYPNHDAENDKNNLTENHWFQNLIELWTRLSVLKINPSILYR